MVPQKAYENFKIPSYDLPNLKINSEFLVIALINSIEFIAVLYVILLSVYVTYKK